MSIFENALDAWGYDWTERLVVGLFALAGFGLVLLIPWMIWASIEEAKEWQAFSVTHDCKVVGRMSSSTSTGLGFGMMSNGQMGTVMTTNTIPAKTGYACNDGVTYWR